MMCEQEKHELIKDQAKGYGHEYTRSPEAGGTVAKVQMTLPERTHAGKAGGTKWRPCCLIHLFSSPSERKRVASSGLTWSLSRKTEGLHNLPDVYWTNRILHSSGNSSKTAIKDKEKEECQQMYEKRENREIIQ